MRFAALLFHYSVWLSQAVRLHKSAQRGKLAQAKEGCKILSAASRWCDSFPTLDLNTTARSEIPLSETTPNHLVAEVFVGAPHPQKLQVLIDTGSSNVWVVSTECQSRGCKAVNAFNSSQSETFRWNSDPTDQLSVSFGTGTLTGRYGRDTIRLGSLEEKDFPFALVTDENGGDNNLDDLFTTIKFEGIVGFGRESLLAPGLRSLNSIFKQTSFVLPRDASVSAAGAANVSTGRVLLHAEPQELDELTDGDGWIVRKAQGEEYWETPLRSVYYGSEKLCCEDGVNASFVIDTGSSGNTLPTPVFYRFSHLSPAYFPCPIEGEAANGLQPLVYNFADERNFTLSPLDLTTKSTIRPDCRLNVMPLNVHHNEILRFVGGVPFLRSYLVTLIDGPEPEIAVARRGYR